MFARAGFSPCFPASSDTGESSRTTTTSPEGGRGVVSIEGCCLSAPLVRPRLPGGWGSGVGAAPEASVPFSSPSDLLDLCFLVTFTTPSSTRFLFPPTASTDAGAPRALGPSGTSTASRDKRKYYDKPLTLHQKRKKKIESKRKKENRVPHPPRHDELSHLLLSPEVAHGWR